MPSVWNTPDRARLLARLERLSPDRRRVWGSLTAPKMVTHLCDSLRATLGEVEVPQKTTPFRFPIVKQLVVYLLPWPKNAPTAPAYLATPPADWDADRSLLRALLVRVAARGPTAEWPPHPAFGRLSGRAWGVLIHRHFDHHLTQFGV